LDGGDERLVSRQLQAGIHARRLIDLYGGQTDQLVRWQSGHAREDRRVRCGQRVERPDMRRHAKFPAFEHLVPRRRPVSN
jgi:hypothetical protein